jgi:hypothetical protein
VTFQATFHIGRVDFRIRSIDHPLRLDLDTAYGPFLGAIRSPGWIHPLQIDARLGTPSVDPAWRQVFEAGEAWRLFHSGDRRIIVRYAGSPLSPLCTASLDEDARSVDLLCSERMLAHPPEGPCLENPVQYPLDQLLLIHALGPRGILVHAAGAVRGGRGILLAGVSGAGKTTISRLLHAHGGFGILSDDRIVVTREEPGFSLHGTPWPGEGGFALDEAAPLAACVLLRKGSENVLRRITATQALHGLLPAVSVLWPEPVPAQQALSVIQLLTAGVPAYEFFFTPDRLAPEALAELPGS